MILNPVVAERRFEDGPGSRRERPRDAGLGIVADAPPACAVAANGLIVRISLVLEKVIAAPHQQVGPAHRPFHCGPAKECGAVSRPLRLLPVGDMMRPQRQQLEGPGHPRHPIASRRRRWLLGLRGLREHDAGGDRHAVADRARVIQLATFVNDVYLQRQRERMGETPLQASAAVEALAVLVSVDTLPVQPQVVLETGTLKEPLQPGLVRAIEGEPLALNRREQSMRTGAIGTGGVPGAWRVERSEDESRAPAPHGQRQHRPHQSKAESLPKRWLTNTPAASRTPLPSSIRASPRAAVPKIVSPSEKALRNSVLSP